MEEYVLFDVLHLVFKYLNYKDLYNSSLVSRYWSQVAIEENYSRGIVTTILYKNNINVTSFVSWEEEHFKYLIKMSGFNIFIVNLNNKGPPRSSCYCNYHKPTCCSLMLRVRCSDETTNFAVSVTFPNSHKIQFNTITFIKIHDQDVVYSPELCSISGSVFIPPPEMKHMIKRYFDQNSPMKSCMIIISEMCSIDIIKNIFFTLKNWFPHSEVFTWGGIVKKISICQNSACKRLIDCTLIFISNKNLKIWVTTWSAQNETEEIIETKLQEFKQRIELKKYSLFLIYRSFDFFADSSILETLFQKVFPKMPYIYFYGSALLAQENLQDIFRNMSEFKFSYPRELNNMENSIMVLTYN
ncbi:hypothetical protein M0802_001322 [Mischocyttarus mexicanus]|nr:hypothetical protein M0802_001322 [Mischocyttarus mexicanus]